MNRLLQRYAHNTVIDQVLYWSANRREIERIIPEPTHQDGARISVQFRDGESDSLEIAPGAFGEVWDEARIVLSTATDIGGDFRPLTERELDVLEPARRAHCANQATILTQQVRRDLARMEGEVDEIFRDGLYEMFLDETGVHLKAPSDTLKAKIAYALKKQKEAQQGRAPNP
jgi:hypothetical protein